MMLPIQQDNTAQLAEHFEQRKFTRRSDLTTAVRIALGVKALGAMINNTWGLITELAKEYNVSRTFIYSLKSILNEAGQYLFGEETPLSNHLIPREQAIEAMLSLRLEGKSSIGAISTIMKRFGFDLSSIGSISQILSRIGSLLPKTLPGKETTQYLVFTSDEIFSKSIPILITVDPNSSAILRIELTDTRKAEDWTNHFKCIFDSGFKPIYLVSDDGQGLCASHKEVMGDVVRQSDTYHAIAHRLGCWIRHLESTAYKAIAYEHECELKLYLARSQKTEEKRWESYIKASKNVEEAISLYDNFSYLYYCILSELNVFDHKGELRSRKNAEGEVEAGLTLIEELGHPKINKTVKKIKRAMPDLFHYLDVAINIIKECNKLPISTASLKAYFLAWQWGKAIRKSKKPEQIKAMKEQEKDSLDAAKYLHSRKLPDIQDKIFSMLDGIVQSSALVECINSIIRPYLNTTKNQVTQEQLNLIMYYHNHRRYCDGKRKDKTPMEILTGKAQNKDWISILFDTIRKKDPELLLAV